MIEHYIGARIRSFVSCGFDRANGESLRTSESDVGDNFKWASPEVGYVAAQKLLATKKHFSALFAFNDVSAYGAIRAFCDAGQRVPQDISVIGFDDVYSAAFQNPPLTTIRQPLQQMGKLAAEIVLRRVAAGPQLPSKGYCRRSETGYSTIGL